MLELTPERITGSFTNRRNQRLFTVKYLPARRPAEAQLLLHHGLAEHCGRYDKVCRLLADNGIIVHAYDAHGHGESQPLAPDDRALVNSYSHLVDDLCDFMDFVQQQDGAVDGAAQQVHSGPQATTPRQVQQPRLQLPQQRVTHPCKPRLPVFLLGHSMGGLVAALACLRRQDQLAGLMLHSPALDVEWTPLLRTQAAVGGLLSAVVPRARVVPAVRPEDLSADPCHVADYVADPLNTVGPTRARTANEMLRGFAEVRQRAPELRLPVYVCHGTRDRITSAPAARRFVEGPGGVSSVDRVFRAVEGGYHELLQGPEWEESARALLAWMRQHGARHPGREAGSGAGEGGGDGGCGLGRGPGTGEGQAAAGCGVASKL